MSETTTIELDPLTRFLNEQGLGHHTALEQEQHPAFKTLIEQWKAAEDAFDVKATTLSQLRAADGYLHSDTAAWPLDESAVKWVGQTLDIPYKYLERLRNTSLFYDNINHFLTTDDEVVVVAKSDENTITEIVPMSTYTKRVPRSAVLQAVAEGLGGTDARVRAVRDELRKSIVKVTVPGCNVAVLNKGDITEAGLMVTIPKNNQAPVISVYMHRLVCTNGMTITVQQSKVAVKGKTPHEILMETKNVAELMWARAVNALDGLKALHEEKVEQPRYMARVIGDEMGVGERATRYAEDLIANFVEEAPDYTLSRYDMVQLYTALTHDDRIKSNLSDKIEAAAGGMVAAAADAERCSLCQRLLPHPHTA